MKKSSCDVMAAIVTASDATSVPLNPTVIGSVATPDHEPVPYTTSIVSLAIVSHEKSVSPSPQSHDETASARFEEPVSTTTGYSYE